MRYRGIFIEPGVKSVKAKQVFSENLVGVRDWAKTILSVKAVNPLSFVEIYEMKEEKVETILASEYIEKDE